jgi:hypothetical protein
MTDTPSAFSTSVTMHHTASRTFVAVWCIVTCPGFEAALEAPTHRTPRAYACWPKTCQQAKPLSAEGCTCHQLEAVIASASQKSASALGRRRECLGSLRIVARFLAR